MCALIAAWQAEDVGEFLPLREVFWKLAATAHSATRPSRSAEAGMLGQLAMYRVVYARQLMHAR